MKRHNPRTPKRALLRSQPDYDTEFLPKLGKVIAKYRKQAAFTQRELAEHLQITVTHISALENGRRGVSLHALYRIAGVIGVELSDIINDTLPPQKSDELPNVSKNYGSY